MEKANVFGLYSKLRIDEKPSPCWNDGKGCPDRDGIKGCHSYCEKFLEWEKKHVEIRREVGEARCRERRITSYQWERAKKAREEFNKP